MKRMFIALDLPEKAKVAFAGCAKPSMHDYRGINWVRPENMHITLKFLGDVHEEALPEIVSRMAKLAGRNNAFSVAYGKLGSFARGGTTASVWVGPVEESNEMLKLAEAVSSVCAALGFPVEAKPFRAHVTLLRAKDWSGLPPWGELRTMFSPVDMTVLHDSFTLYESILTPDGPIYRPETNFRLKKD